MTCVCVCQCVRASVKRAGTTSILYILEVHSLSRIVVLVSQVQLTLQGRLRDFVMKSGTK